MEYPGVLTVRVALCLIVPTAINNLAVGRAGREAAAASRACWALEVKHGCDVVPGVRVDVRACAVHLKVVHLNHSTLCV